MTTELTPQSILGKTTLTNLGNTCYMNSIIQVLSHTPLLREYILSGDYIETLKRNCKTDEKHEFMCTIIVQYHKLLHTQWNSEGLISPLILRSIIGTKNDMFRGNQQHDSHEFIIWFLDKIHNELETKVLINNQQIKLNDFKTSNDQLYQLKALDYWNKYCNNNSITTNLFTGLFQSEIECDVCSFKSITFDPFTNISLDIPTKQNCTLYDCLESMTETEQLDNDNKVRCDRCYHKNQAHKTTSILYFPKILIIQLKRFKKNMCGQIFNKNNSNVSYPKILYLDNYSSDLTEQKSKYKLFAVNIHAGMANYGHYYSYIMNTSNDTWYCYNDETVTPIKNIQSNNAYLLFYINTKC
jgi:ubiquitin C-terminal hydrolase